MYEIKDKQNLHDVIEYANGIDKDADMSNIYLDRIQDGRFNQLKLIISNSLKL